MSTFCAGAASSAAFRSKSIILFIHYSGALGWRSHVTGTSCSVACSVVRNQNPFACKNSDVTAATQRDAHGRRCANINNYWQLCTSQRWGLHPARSSCRLNPQVSMHSGKCTSSRAHVCSIDPPPSPGGRSRLPLGSSGSEGRRATPRSSSQQSLRIGSPHPSTLCLISFTATTLASKVSSLLSIIFLFIRNTPPSCPSFPSCYLLVPLSTNATWEGGSSKERIFSLSLSLPCFPAMPVSHSQCDTFYANSMSQRAFIKSNPVHLCTAAACIRPWRLSAD